MIIDTHSHFYLPEFDTDRQVLFRKAQQSGVNKFLLPNIDASSVGQMLALEAEHPEHCCAMMGLHPCSVNDDYDRELSIVRSWLDKRKFTAIGEIGLDLYWDKTYFDQQVNALQQQLDWALEFDYCVSIHCRNAFDQLYEILRSRSRLPRAVFHCFSGTEVQARQIIELGNFALGIGGVVTFRNSGLDKVVCSLGLDHLVLETDAPYLAPVPFRGKRNEPAYILEVAKKVAELTQTSLQEVEQKTTANAQRFFGI